MLVIVHKDQIGDIRNYINTHEIVWFDGFDGFYFNLLTLFLIRFYCLPLPKCISVKINKLKSDIECKLHF